MSRLVVIGARGRLGSLVARVAAEFGWEVVLRATRDDWPAAPADVVIDASSRQACPATVALCRSSGAALVYAVSDPTADDLRELRRLAEDVPVVRAPNASIGHHVQVLLAELAHEQFLALSPTEPWEAHVLDRHPITKRDRPSATAKRLAEQVGETGGPPARLESVRMGQPVASHVVTFEGDREQLEISHHVMGLEAAARGLLHAARRAPKLGTGWWTMTDVYDAKAAEA